MCRLRDCSVCECPESEFPESFKKPKRLPLNDLVCQEGKPEAAVDRTLDSKAFRGWTEIDNPWTNDETDNGVLLSLSTSSNLNYFCL
jgi:ERO1-like protein alpha